jgi:hypothetical protein
MIAPLLLILLLCVNVPLLTNVPVRLNVSQVLVLPISFVTITPELMPARLFAKGTPLFQIAALVQEPLTVAVESAACPVVAQTTKTSAVRNVMNELALIWIVFIKVERWLLIKIEGNSNLNKVLLNKARADWS